MGKKVAVVGSGCTGLAAVWALKSTDHEVHLYEADSILGGHTNTVSFKAGKNQRTNVDVGFIVLNTATYPNFIAFLEHVGVKPEKTEMTFGVSRDQGKFEWSGTSLSSVFAQRKNIFSPRMWRLIFDIVRFNEFAVDVLRKGDQGEHDLASRTSGKASKLVVQESIGEYLDREGYSQAFRDDYLIPMTAAVWSTSPDKCSLHFPAMTLIRFMWNHHLLNTVAARPDWMTIPSGSRRYIQAIMEDFPRDRLHTKAKVTSAVPNGDGTVLLTVNGEQVVFDHVILATHGDQALDIVRSSATDEEIEVLSGFQTSRNIVVLHSDTSLMPKRREAWSSWNYITQSPFPPNGSSNISKVCLTYWMNLLQHIPENKFGPVLVTLNPLKMPDPLLAQGIWEYSHPLYNAAAIRSQTLLPGIQNTRNISYCGAWTKYGFHEDGFSSGLSAAVNHLGAKLPFKFVDSTFSRGQTPALTWQNYLLRAFLIPIHMAIIIVSRVLQKLLVYLNDRAARKERLN